MFTHSQIWKALDTIAERNGLSVSGLAKKAGLDPTSFNKSKRVTGGRRARWPSTESVSKVLDSTATSVEELAALLIGIDPDSAMKSKVPLIGLAQAGGGGYFDDAGFPVGASWEEVAFPGISDHYTYALEISGDSMLPVYRDGDIIVVSPDSSVRRGDRVVAKTHDGEVLAKVLQRRSATTVELASFNPEHDTRTFNARDIDWMARIIWASQ